MKPIKTPLTTTIYRGEAGEVQDLPVFVDHFEANVPICKSFWRPTWRDVLRMLRGQPVRLSVIGRKHPPVRVDTEEA